MIVNRASSMRAKDPAVIEEVFGRIVQAAVRNERCPLNNEGVYSDVAKQLALSGRIMIEVFGKNYRVITILEGEHAGRHTDRAPVRGWLPYLVIDKKGTRRIRT
jgi:hypothetical protein